MRRLLLNPALRALFVRGRKLVLASPACIDICCGTPPPCLRFVSLAPCVPPGGPSPFCDVTAPPIAACDDTLCTGGTPAFPPGSESHLWIINGRCYTRLPGTFPPDGFPEGTLFLAPGTRIQCLGPAQCNDERCPTGRSFYEAQPCAGSQADITLPHYRVFVCVGLVTDCGTFDFGFRTPDGRPICYRLQPSTIFGESELPGGATIITTPIGTGLRSCCACLQPAVCAQVALAEGGCRRLDPTVPPGTICCCAQTDRYQVTRYAYRHENVRIGTLATGTLLSSQIATPLQAGVYRVRHTQTVPPSSSDTEHFVPTACGWQGFSFNDPTGFFPSPGHPFGTPYCQSFTDAGAGHRVIITAHVQTVRCGYYSYSMSWEHFVDFGGGFVRNIVGHQSFAVRRTADQTAPCAGECFNVPLFPPGSGGQPDAPPGPTGFGDLVIPAGGLMA